MRPSWSGLCAAVAAAALGCGGGAGPTPPPPPPPPPPPTVASIALSFALDTLESIGETVTLTATPKDAAGGTVSGATVTFSSDALPVASVVSSGATTGLITAVANGTASVTAASGTVRNAATIVVRQVVASVVVTPSSVTLTSLGQTAQLAAEARDARNNVMSGQTFGWSSDRTSVATVNSSSGLVTAVDTGSAMVSATTASRTGQAAVRVDTLVSFGTQIQPIFTGNCALSGCHGSTSPQEGMNLSSGSAYANIVNVASRQVPSLMRVRPSLPDSSYLVHKIQGTQANVGGSGNRMPEGGAALPQATINLIRRWISQGALNN